MTKTTPMTALALVAASITPAFAQEASNDDFRAVLTVGLTTDFRTTIIEGYSDLDSCLLQAKIATSSPSYLSSIASVSCEKGGKVIDALTCRKYASNTQECERIDLSLPAPKR